MKKIQHRLLYVFWIPIILSAIIILLAESDVFGMGIMANNRQLEFVIMCVMEIVTIILIPCALKLFKFNLIAKKINSEKSLETLAHWGVIRLLMLNILMLINIVCYYLFMGVGFGYLAIILFLSLFFVYPSLSRCYNETGSYNS